MTVKYMLLFIQLYVPIINNFIYLIDNIYNYIMCLNYQYPTALNIGTMYISIRVTSDINVLRRFILYTQINSSDDRE